MHYILGEKRNTPLLSQLGKGENWGLIHLNAVVFMQMPAIHYILL